MRNYVLWFIILFLSIGMLYSQEITLDDKIEIERIILKEGLSTGTNTGLMYFGPSISGFVTYDSPNRWTPYLSNERISESEFFSIAGLYDASKEAKRHRDSAITITLAGASSMIMGAFFLGFSTMIEENETLASASGFAFSGIGVSLCILGINKLWKPWAPPEYAQSAADKYNLELVNSYIKKKASL